MNYKEQLDKMVENVMINTDMRIKHARDCNNLVMSDWDAIPKYEGWLTDICRDSKKYHALHNRF
jgi:hypothetical protein